ncbi:carboxypeptidase N subunit 2 [Parasteatoda tepidariorum]|uniref:carboxypeptidase N subunit 2 n=1 Tax=Parasteatoda tepidariorum TaxID=114398 RepID=UPI00077FA6A9|nr:insulin-like growth factor-binding protein complex acid labile subunit [Parasteatoda tepidariorum]XP_015926638.1 insulin-like growth factor-binding protein complex acid labile subunit [Parasteatoda tepidariorum]
MEILVLLLLFWIAADLASARCPKQCTCALKFGRKTVFCSGGGLNYIPVAEMDMNVHELVITSPPDNPNNITVGRIFFKFSNLETVRIIKSGIPAIGDSSFWPGRRLRVLDLSHNAISFLRESDFNGLKNLIELDLSDNEIFATPSAPFRHLLNLKKLSLAQNKLQNLVPRFFYLLSQLEELNLSGNVLGFIDPEILQDVRNLKVLKIGRCRLLQVHPMLYQQLPVLEHLDLRDNYLTSLSPGEFRHLQHLSTLQMDGNALVSLTEGIFHGQTLQKLGLSRNNLSSLSDKTFTNATIRALDISYNKLEYVLRDTFTPLGHCLEVLNISHNPIGNQAFFSIIHSLRNLKCLRSSRLKIKNLLRDVFASNTKLVTLNLSHNAVVEISPDILYPLENLESLDVSFNKISTLAESVLEALFNKTFFRNVHLHGNPFDCSSCQIAPIFHFANETHFVDGNDSFHECLQCEMPIEWKGRCIISLQENQITCQNIIFDRQYLEYTSQVGLMVAISIIVLIVTIILVIIVIYRRHIAHYYTHEEEQRAWKGIYENPALVPSGGVHYGEPTFISTGDKVDENIEDIRTP